MKRFEPRKIIISLMVLLPSVILVAVLSGAVTIPLTEFFRLMQSGFFNDTAEIAHKQDIYEAILLQIRLPRVILAAAIGSVLAISGAAMQGLFRNPLADPSLIGVTAGASLGASIMIVVSASYGVSWLGLPLITLGAFLGGILAVTIVYRLATSVQGTSIATMLLAGIGITALAGAAASLLEFYASNTLLRNIRIWHMGSLDNANLATVSIALSIALALFILIPRYSADLNVLLLGESEAKHLGIQTEKLKQQLIILVAAGVGVAVALAGTIAFVGLVIPHILRLIIGPNHRYLLPASALAGAILLVVADNVARVVLAPTELPVGLITAVIGVPFFISLLTRRYVYGLS